MHSVYFFPSKLKYYIQKLCSQTFLIFEIIFVPNQVRLKCYSVFQGAWRVDTSPRWSGRNQNNSVWVELSPRTERWSPWPTTLLEATSSASSRPTFFHRARSAKWHLHCWNMFYQRKILFIVILRSIVLILRAVYGWFPVLCNIILYNL